MGHWVLLRPFAPSPSVCPAIFSIRIGPILLSNCFFGGWLLYPSLHLNEVMPLFAIKFACINQLQFHPLSYLLLITAVIVLLHPPSWWELRFFVISTCSSWRLSALIHWGSAIVIFVILQRLFRTVKDDINKFHSFLAVAFLSLREILSFIVAQLINFYNTSSKCNSRQDYWPSSTWYISQHVPPFLLCCRYFMRNPCKLWMIIVICMSEASNPNQFELFNVATFLLFVQQHTRTHNHNGV